MIYKNDGNDNKNIKKIDDDMLKTASGGDVFFAGNISGSDPTRPYEVTNDVTGDVVARFASLKEAEDSARSYGLSTSMIDWNTLQAKRNKW
ncbi:MAG: hypothetical protein K5931_01510 [Lachnospiraceae bacterium]|nr:hypothetical protein [Lachnospiraceae bacterium]